MPQVDIIGTQLQFCRCWGDGQHRCWYVIYIASPSMLLSQRIEKFEEVPNLILSIVERVVVCATPRHLDAWVQVLERAVAAVVVEHPRLFDTAIA